MSVPVVLALVAILFIYPLCAQENCYRARRPFKSVCALPDLLTMRTALCSSAENWGEGFPFLSGRGVVLRMQDNCTADNAPLGIDLTMTISSTIKNRTDCLERTASIINRCVDKGFPEFNGGAWWDTAEPGQTFIWMQYQHIDPPPVPNPCYEYPPPSHCPEYPWAPESGRETEDDGKLQRMKDLSLKATYIDMDVQGETLRTRHVH